VDGSNAFGQDKFFRRSFQRIFTSSVVLAFFVNIFAFSFPVELALVPLAFLLVAVSMVAARKDELAKVKRPLDWIVEVVGMALVVHSAILLAARWHATDHGALARTFVLPFWLSVELVPFVYTIGLIAGYELAFLRIDLGTERTPVDRRLIKLATISVFHARNHSLNRFAEMTNPGAIKGSSFRDLRHSIRDATFPKGDMPPGRAAERGEAS
jgi:hypothetical protein